MLRAFLIAAFVVAAAPAKTAPAPNPAVQALVDAAEAQAKSKFTANEKAQLARIGKLYAKGRHAKASKKLEIFKAARKRSEAQKKSASQHAFFHAVTAASISVSMIAQTLAAANRGLHSVSAALIALSAALDGNGQTVSVTVYGWDYVAKEPIEGEARTVTRPRAEAIKAELETVAKHLTKQRDKEIKKLLRISAQDRGRVNELAAAID